MNRPLTEDERNILLFQINDFFEQRHHGVAYRDCCRNYIMKFRRHFPKLSK